MKIVIEIGTHDGDDHVTHHATEKFPLRIGRGYNNDIILQDPHISGHHAEILHNGADWVLSDMGSTNGSRVNGKDCKDGTAILHSGDTITLGRTTLRIFDPQHPVPAATPMEVQSRIVKALQGHVLPWLLFFAAIAAAVTRLYFDTWVDDTKYFLINFSAGVGMLIILWAVPWAVTGRLMRHKSYYQTQVALASLFTILASVAISVMNIVNFYTNENVLAAISSYLLQIVFCGTLLYGCLTVSTYMTKKRRKTIAAFFAIGLVTIIYATGYIGKDSFEIQPSYPTVLEPYLDRWLAVDTMDSFMTDNEALFDAAALKDDTP